MTNPGALKLQAVAFAVLGSIVLDSRGQGEPHDQHKTLAESDPKDEAQYADQQKKIDWFTAPALDEDGEETGKTNGEMMNWILADMKLAGAGASLQEALGDSVHPIVRVMDGDGQS